MADYSDSYSSDYEFGGTTVERAATLDVTATIASEGEFAWEWSDPASETTLASPERAASLDATASIAAAGAASLHLRSADLSATASIVSGGFLPGAVTYDSGETYDSAVTTYDGAGGGGATPTTYERSAALDATASIDTAGIRFTVRLPELIVEADYTTLPRAIPTDWVSLAPFRAISIHQGRQRLLDRTEVGAASVTLDNRERDYDPTIHPEVRPGNHLRIRAVVGLDTVDLFRGFVRSWPQEWPGTVDAISTVQVEDAFALMARYELEGDAIAEMSSGDHIREVLTNFGWPEAGSIPEGTEWWILEDAGSELGTNTFLGESLAEIDDGVSTIMATDLTGNLLDHLLNVAETTEGGTFYVGPSGDLVFRQRQVGGDEPIGTWGDEEGEYRYTDLVITYDDSQIYNDIRLTRRGGELITASDDESAELYGPRTLQISDLLHSTSAATEERAGQLLIKHSLATLYPQSITMRPKPDSPLWGVALGIPLGTAITVRRRPPGGGEMIELPARVIGVTYDISPDLWEITWDLADAPRFIDVWLLGQTGRSELGTTTALG